MIDDSNFQPLHALILVRRESPESERGGIIIPDNVKTYGWRAAVIRSGPEVTDYTEGEDIFFQKEFTVLPFKDRTLALTDAKHVLAKLVVAENAEVIVPQNKFVLIEPFGEYDKPAVIFTPDKAKKSPRCGRVIRKSIECLDVKVDCVVWFDSDTGVNCVEDGMEYKLIDESDILAMEVS